MTEQVPILPEYQAIMDKILEAKKARRQELARLPFEQKVAILVQLQKIAREVRVATGRSPTPVWEIGD